MNWLRQKLRLRSLAALAVIVAGLAIAPVVAQAAELVVFAAASLKEALDDAAKLYAAQGGEAPRISYAASSALARQIESGVPADIFISADLDWIDYLQQRNRRKFMLEDFAVLTGGQVISEDLGIKLESVTLDMLGTAKKARIDKDSTTIIDGAGEGGHCGSLHPAARANRGDELGLRQGEMAKALGEAGGWRGYHPRGRLYRDRGQGAQGPRRRRDACYSRCG